MKTSSFSLRVMRRVSLFSTFYLFVLGSHSKVDAYETHKSHILMVWRWVDWAVHSLTHPILNFAGTAAIIHRKMKLNVAAERRQPLSSSQNVLKTPRNYGSYVCMCRRHSTRFVDGAGFCALSEYRMFIQGMPGFPFTLLSAYVCSSSRQARVQLHRNEERLQCALNENPGGTY